MSSKNTAQLDTVSSIFEAALRLLRKRAPGLTMAEIAKEAGISRQAVYLHFKDRTDLLVRLARYVDEKRGLAEELRKIEDAPSGVDALAVMTHLHARMNPGVWPIAEAVLAVHRTDKAADKAWSDRLDSRLDSCRKIVARLHKEGSLKPGLTREVAADLLWSMTSLRAWEDLVLHRGWSDHQYATRMAALLQSALTC